MPLEQVREKGYDRLRLIGPWRYEYAAKVREYGGLEINNSTGAEFFQDLDFLEDIGSLKVLLVTNLALTSSEGLRYLDGQLQTLGLSSYDTVPVDFSRWNRLVTCSFDWRKRSESLYSCTSLKDLHINRPALRSMSELSGLANLERLTLTSTRRLTDLALEGLSSLRDLRITLANRITSLDGVEAAPQLTRLDLATCRGIHNLDRIAELPNLRFLAITNGGDIESLAPLAGHPSLEEFYFYESTNIVDGNLTVLRTIPHLRDIAYKKRKHYDCRCEELLA